MVATGKLKYRESIAQGIGAGARSVPRPAEGQELRQAAGQAGLKVRRDGRRGARRGVPRPTCGRSAARRRLGQRGGAAHPRAPPSWRRSPSSRTLRSLAADRCRRWRRSRSRSRSASGSGRARGCCSRSSSSASSSTRSSSSPTRRRTTGCFASAALNDAVGRAIGMAGAISMCTYRVIHRLHHNNLYSDDDPDTAIHGGYPRGIAYLWKKLAPGR